MNQVFTIAKKEFFSFINSATGYIIMAVFVLLSMFLLWRSNLASSESSMRDFFQIFPWFSMILVPAITMRSLTDEKKSQTLEVLLSHPVKEWQIVLGKMLGSWMYLFLVILATLPSAITFSLFSRFDWGLLISQYVGALVMGGAFVGLGVLVASYTENLITSFLTTAALSFAWILTGMDYLIMVLPPQVGSLIREISITLRAESFNRGIINFKEIVFFITVISLFAMFATIRLMVVKTVENQSLKSKLLLTTVVLTSIGLVLYQILGNLNFRIDMTKNQSATLSNASKQTLSQLDDLVSVTFYTSSNVPGEFVFTKKYTQDLLADYVNQSKGKIKLTEKNPDTNTDIAKEAVDAGIQVVQFNSFGQNKFQSENGYFGISINYGAKSDSIGFITDPQNLEYEITRRIRKLTRSSTQEIGIASISSLTSYQNYSLLSQYLGTQYSLTDIDLTTQSDKLASISALLIASPSEQLDSTTSAVLNNYLNNGGRMMLFIDKVEPNTQFGTASFKNNDWNGLLGQYGVSVNSDAIYDLLQNESISIPTNGLISYAINYPYWVKSSVADNFAPISGIQAVTMAWPSSLSINKIEGVNQNVLLKTSNQAGSSTGTFSIAPDQLPVTSQNKSFDLGVAIEKGNTRIVVVSDADMMIDQFTQYNGANAAFVSNLLDWLASDNTQLIVPRRDFSPAILQFSDPDVQVPLTQWGNVIGVPVLIGLIGSWYLRRRQLLSNRQWSKN